MTPQVRPPAMAGVDGNKDIGTAIGEGIGFARQQWRAWIETPKVSRLDSVYGRFARQQWRAWIETSATASLWPGW